MSEDIDIKIALDRVPDGYALPKGHSDRKRLGDLHDEVERRLKEQGFEYVQTAGASNPLSRDNRRYYCLAVSYRAFFEDVSGALRPQLKLELVHRPPILPVETREMGYLLDRFIPRMKPVRFAMTCISVEETLAEKVLSMLRRCAWKWDRRQHGEFDTTLVRHIYDVWCIANSKSADVTVASGIFAALVAQDVKEFRGQHPEFDEQPFVVLRRTLDATRANEELPRHFEQRLRPLVFADKTPDFDECLASFTAIAEQFVSTSAQLVDMV